MKTKLLLNLGTDVDNFTVESGHSCARCGFLLTEEMCEIFHDLVKLEETMDMDNKMALIYIAGYIIRKDIDIRVGYQYLVTWPVNGQSSPI